MLALVGVLDIAANYNLIRIAIYNLLTISATQEFSLLGSLCKLSLDKSRRDRRSTNRFTYLLDVSDHCPKVTTFQVIQQLLQFQLMQQRPTMYQMLTDQICVDQNQHTSNFHLVSATVAVLKLVEFCHYCCNIGKTPL